MAIRIVFTCLALAVSACATAAARGPVPAAPKDPLTVAVSAHVGAAPAQLVVRTRIEPDARNRVLSIQWWNGDGVGGSHTVNLEGDRAARRHDCLIKGMTAGEYTVSAVVMRSEGQQLRRSTTVFITGEGESFDASTFGERLRRQP